MEDLTRHYQPSNHFPALLIKAADWIDIKPDMPDGIIETVMEATADIDLEGFYETLEAHEDDYDLMAMTQEETREKIIGLLNRTGKPLTIYRHIAVIVIHTETLKEAISPYL